jgi:hypothetical protein
MILANEDEPKKELNESLERYNSENYTENMISIQVMISRIGEKIESLVEKKKKDIDIIHKKLEDLKKQSDHEIHEITENINSEIENLKKRQENFCKKIGLVYNDSLINSIKTESPSVQSQENKRPVSRKRSRYTIDKDIKYWANWSNKVITNCDKASFATSILSCWFMWKIKSHDNGMDLSKLNFNMIITAALGLSGFIENNCDFLVSKKQASRMSVLFPRHNLINNPDNTKKILEQIGRFSEFNAKLGLVLSYGSNPKTQTCRELFSESIVKLTERNKLKILTPCILFTGGYIYPLLIDDTKGKHFTSNGCSIWMFDIYKRSNNDKCTLFLFETIDRFINHIYKYHTGRCLNKKTRKQIKMIDERGTDYDVAATKIPIKPRSDLDYVIHVFEEKK